MPRYLTATTRAFAEHWFALPRAGLLPTLATFLDRPMPQFQPRVALTEIISEAEVRYRLVGTELVEGFGQERTGENILNVTAPELRPALYAMFKRIVSEPCGARALVRARSNRDREIKFETVCLPLAREAAHPVIVGCNETLRELDLDEALVQFAAMEECEWITL